MIRVIRRRRVILVSSQCPSWPACWRARRPAGTTHLDWRLPVTRPCYAVDWGSRCCIRGAEWGRFVQPLAGYGFLGPTSATRVPRSLVSAELSIGCLLIPGGKKHFWAFQISRYFRSIIQNYKQPNCPRFLIEFLTVRSPTFQWMLSFASTVSVSFYIVRPPNLAFIFYFDFKTKWANVVQLQIFWSFYTWMWGN